MKWSTKGCLTILLCLISCSTSSIIKNQGIKSSIATSHELVRKYGTYPTSTFLLSIISTLKKSMKMNDAISVSVLATKQPIAASTETGQILISQGLILSLTTEAELAFILAHELSHIKLQHFEKSQSAEVETEADNLALISIYRAGYNVKASINALSLPYNHNSIHLSPTERVDNINKTLRSLPISLYGVVDTNEAREFRKSLHYD